MTVINFLVFSLIYLLTCNCIQILHVGKFPIDAEMSSNLSHDALDSSANEFPPALPHKQRNLGATKLTSLPEYEDTGGLLPPPPLPPKN